MFAVRLNGLGENKFATNHLNELRLVEDRETAELIAGQYPETFRAEVVDAPEDESKGKFVPKMNDETGKWGLWNNKTQKWAGDNLNNREEARKLARILNSQS